MNFDPKTELSRPEGPASDGRSRAAIVSDLWSNTEALVSQELNLLRRDLEQRMTKARRDLLELSLAGAVTYIGVMALAAAAVLLLAKRIEPWAAAAIVGLLALAVGYGMLHHAIRKLARQDMVPRTAIQSAENTTHTIKEALR